MPPRLPRMAVGFANNSLLSKPRGTHQTCLICSASRTVSSTKRPRRPHPQRQQPRIHTRKASVQASASDVSEASRLTPNQARKEFRDALLDLQKHAGSFVNVSRLQLALRGLEQPAGQETIRIAILALADGGNSLQKAKELARLIVADPLKSEEEWERVLMDSQKTSRPLLLKIGHDGSDEHGSRLIKQLNVASPLWVGHRLEILVLEIEAPSKLANTTPVDFQESILVPTLEIPTSSSGRYTPVTTPVHKALIVGDGIIGASSILSRPAAVGEDDSEITWAAMDLKVSNGGGESTLPFQIIDVSAGTSALALFRESVENALIYEQSWFSSGIPPIADWIKSDSSPRDGTLKVPVQRLINSILENAHTQIETERSRRLAALLSDKISSSELNDLKKGLLIWAERAHTELRDQLDIAFEGNRWSKLSWWKLFWRVDDVTMIATDILNQRFLTEAEKEVIFLCGRIAQSGIVEDIPEAAAKASNWAYKPVTKDFEEKMGTEAPDPQLKNILERPEDRNTSTLVTDRPWPLQIPITRGYLSTETVPALQALSQKLLLQTLSTSFFSSTFAGLMYVSTLSTSFYEAGAVAALGIVWSMRRMQTKWEAARKFWEGEVREEGRKAVRGVESEIGDILVPLDRPVEGAEELAEAKKAVARAEAALEATR